jgi:hypothetical protein
MCDPQGNPFPGQVRVGLYEGADYYHCDAFRPVFNCKFRVLSADFCPVCIRRMLQVLQPFQPANSPPVANAGGPYVAECTGTTSVTLDGSQSSDADCNALSYTWTGPFVGGTATGATPTVQFTGTGVFTVNLAVSDGLATGTASTTVTVRDTVPPTIQCPPNITQANDPGQCSAVVLFQVTASDICDGSLTPVCNPPSGSVFPKGTTTVSCSVSDAAGNSSSCTFTVTVEDREAPRIACRQAPNPSSKKIPVSGKNPSSGQNPDGYYQLLAKDNCDPNPKLYVKDTASSFIAGPFASGDIVKLSQNPGGTPSSDPSTPPIVAHIHLNGDALGYAVDADGNVSDTCLMLIPPAPK